MLRVGVGCSVGAAEGVRVGRWVGTGALRGSVGLAVRSSAVELEAEPGRALGAALGATEGRLEDLGLEALGSAVWGVVQPVWPPNLPG